MRVIVCGGRKFNDIKKIESALNTANKKRKIELLIEGGAEGVDFHSKNWALKSGIPSVTCNAAWVFLGKRAGPIRNGNMIKLLKPDALIAFQGNKGTKDMIARAEKAGLIVWVVK